MEGAVFTGREEGTRVRHMKWHTFTPLVLARDAAGKYLPLPGNNPVDWSVNITAEQIPAAGGTQGMH